MAPVNRDTKEPSNEMKQRGDLNQQQGNNKHRLEINVSSHGAIAKATNRDLHFKPRNSKPLASRCQRMSACISAALINLYPDKFRAATNGHTNQGSSGSYLSIGDNSCDLAVLAPPEKGKMIVNVAKASLLPTIKHQLTEIQSDVGSTRIGVTERPELPLKYTELLEKTTTPEEEELLQQLTAPGGNYTCPHLTKLEKLVTRVPYIHGSTRPKELLYMHDLYENYEVNEELGRGGEGVVFSGRRYSDGAAVAVKRVFINRWLTEGPHPQNLLPLEYAIVHKAAENNPGVMKMITWYQDPRYAREVGSAHVLVMERFNEKSTDLSSLIRENLGLPENLVRILFRQVVVTIMKCHQNLVAHRDVKPSNLIVNLDTMQVKLIDFGCATRLRPKDHTIFAGTREYFPPEWFIEKRFRSNQVDVWSLGILLYKMLEGNIPFCRREDGTPDFKFPLFYTKSFDQVSPAARVLVSKILRVERYRPTLKEILEDPWFTIY